MSRVAHRTSAPWVVTILALLVVVGHVCELPAFADAARLALTSTHHHDTPDPDHHHDRNHHADETSISCDPIDAARTVSSDAGVTLEVAAIDAPTQPRVVRVAPGGLLGPPAPPPLYLLHRSLLI
jgi:hypothetical protein